MNSRLDRKGAVKKLRTLVLKPKMDVEQYRTKLEEVFSTVFLPNNVECQQKEFGGIKCDVLIPELYSTDKIMIYIHGGSFVGGSRESWRNFCSSVANATSCKVILPDFRLPPSHPYPASLDDLQMVFNLLSLNEEAERESKGLSKDVKYIIACDGTGASLAIALMFRLKGNLKKNVTNLIMFSPWLDFTSTNSVVSGGKKNADEVVSGDDLHRAVDLYTYAANITNPSVSSLRAPSQDFKDFPEVYIQMGEKEITKAQVDELTDKLDEAEVPYILDIWKDMMFMFQMADEYLSESHLAIEKLGNYIKKREGLDSFEKSEREKILRKNNIAIEDY